MRQNSVFTFLKTKFNDLYKLTFLMEKFIVTKKYKLVIATSKVILDLFSKYIDKKFVFTIDVFNDSDILITKRDVESVHHLLFEYIYIDYFAESEEFLQIDYEFDFTFLGDNPKITDEEIFLMLENLKIDTISPKFINMEGEDLINFKDLEGDFKTHTLNVVKNNLDEFIKDNILNLDLFDSESNLLNRSLNFKAFIKGGMCVVREVPVDVCLDAYQKDAVEFVNKPLVINAGPGAGKTRVIIERVVYLIENGASAESILVITFTNKAAEELRERFKKDTNLDLNTINQMRISTIHSFCRSILSDFSDIPYNLLKRESERNLFFNKHKEELGFKNEAFLRNYESGEVLKKYDEYALFEVNSDALIDYLSKKYIISKDYISYINDFYKNHSSNQYPSKKEIDHLGFKCESYKARYLQIAKSYPKWIELMEEEHVCDQNYLLIKALEILKSDSNLKSLVYKNILIDEFQDTDAVQMQIFERLFGISNTFTVVGDADQSIYSFRAANPKFFNDYIESEDFEHKVLVNNYRSTSEIVEFNEKFIKQKRQNKKDLKTINSSKMPVYLLENKSDEEEYKGIAYIIRNLKNSGKITKYSDVCVLFRSHRDKKEILEEFDRQNIPYYLKGIDDLIYQDEVKAILTLIWYMLPFSPSRISYYGDKGQWINLSSFTDKYYHASKIFKLSHKTQEILNDIELRYHSSVVNIKNQFKPLEDNSNSKSIMDVVRNYSDETLNEIFKKANIIDFSNLSRMDLVNMGIVDEHDLDFFSSLNEFKNSLKDSHFTSLQVFYELLNITGFADELLDRSDFEAKKALLNLSLISEIISDYENIMGKYDLVGLFNYIHRSLKYYSCPINEEEDNTNKVHIMTVHKAKGLEYPVVITSSIKDKSFPLVFSPQRKSYLFQNRPVYPTPNKFLKYKVSQDLEAEEFNREEERVVYVANTRAEELLILSTVSNRIGHGLPKVLSDFEDDVLKIEPSDVVNMKKVSTHFIGDNNLFNQIDFECILEDYLFCPLKYNLENILKFKNPKNINKFIDSKIKIIVNRLHNDNLMTDWDEESISNLIGEVIRSYSFASDEANIKELFTNFYNYWRDYGRNFEVLKTSHPVSLDVNGYAVNGVVDLIISDGEGVSLVHFIKSRGMSKNYHHFYMTLLEYYAKALSESEDVIVENLLLYVLDEAKLYEIPYQDNNFIKDYLESIVANIDNNSYAKHKKHCEMCEFSSIICKDL